MTGKRRACNFTTRHPGSDLPIFGGGRLDVMSTPDVFGFCDEVSPSAAGAASATAGVGGSSATARAGRKITASEHGGHKDQENTSLKDQPPVLPKVKVEGEFKVGLSPRKLSTALTDLDEDEDAMIVDAPMRGAAASGSSASAPHAVDDVVDDDDVQFVSRSGDLALVDYPHAREFCCVHKFIAGKEHDCCDNCFCYVCGKETLVEASPASLLAFARAASSDMSLHRLSSQKTLRPPTAHGGARTASRGTVCPRGCGSGSSGFYTRECHRHPPRRPRTSRARPPPDRRAFLRTTIDRAVSSAGPATSSSPPSSKCTPSRSPSRVASSRRSSCGRTRSSPFAS